MIKKNKTTVLLAAAIAGLLTLRYCDKQKQREDVISAPVLKDNEKQKIIIDTNKKTVTTVRRNNKKQVVGVKEGARKVTVIEDKDGNIRVEVVDKGFCFEPGLALYYSDKLRLGVDVQWAYYKRWGALLGAGVNMGDEPRTVRAHIAVTYALPLSFIQNTSAFAGIDNKKDLTVGVRVRF